MANLSINPWSLTGADVASAAITAATGLTLNADGTVTITCGALTFNTNGVPPANWFTVIGATNPVYNGEYLRIAGASGATSFTMVPATPAFVIPPGTAQSGSGTLVQVLWPWGMRGEDISWQNVVTATQTLDLRDRNGGIIWQAAIGASVPAAGSQNRGKTFWTDGIAPVTISTGIVLITVN